MEHIDLNVKDKTAKHLEENIGPGKEFLDKIPKHYM